MGTREGRERGQNWILKRRDTGAKEPQPDPHGTGRTGASHRSWHPGKTFGGERRLPPSTARQHQRGGRGAPRDENPGQGSQICSRTRLSLAPRDESTRAVRGMGAGLSSSGAPIAAGGPGPARCPPVEPPSGPFQELPVPGALRLHRAPPPGGSGP